MVFGSGNGNVVVGDGALPVRDTVKCLGYWWSKDLVALKCVDENIKKARKAFFGYGSLGVFQSAKSHTRVACFSKVQLEVERVLISSDNPSIIAI